LILYKYLTATALNASINNLTLRFTIPSFFNDPFDCASSTTPTQKNHSENLTNYLRAHFHRNKTGALCLTRNPFNLLMWAHYASDHQGAVIGIDTEISGLECENKNIISAKNGSIIYTSVRPQAFDIPLDFTSKSDRANLEAMFLHKSIHWAYEEEVRVLKIINSDFDEFTVVHKEMSFSDFEIPKEAIREIYLGARFQPTDMNKTLVNDILSDFTDIKFAKCHLSNNKWEIHAKAISKMRGELGFYFL